jgi:hypothetical protein
MNRSNGGYIGILKEDASVYPFSGVYPLYEHQENKLAGLWPDRADASFANTSLLLKTTSQSTRSTTVIDSSVNNFAVTRSGTPSTGWNSPYQTPGYWSNYFGSSTDKLSFGTSTNLALGAGDWTVECWYFPTTTGAYRTLFDWRTAGFSPAGIPVISVNPTDFLVVDLPGGTTILTSSIAVTLNAWNHIAYSRSSNTIRVFVNGALGGSVSNSTNLGIETFSIGYTSVPYGYISNARIVKGVAVYTSNFTPSTAPLTAISGTSLLTCQNNRFIDNSTNNFAVTLTGTPQTTSYWYPSTFSAPAASVGGGYFNGTTDYLATPANAAFAFGTGDFTVECWIFITYQLGTAGQGRGVLVSNRSAASSSTSLVLQHYNSKIYFGTPSTDLIASTTTLTINNWTHIAVSRSSGTLRLFVNGVLDTTVASNITNFSDTNAFAIGTDGLYLAYYFTGQISNLRLVKGTAVYTGNFTPPTDFLTTTAGTYPSTANIVTSIASSNTSLLLNLADSNYTSFANTSNNNAFIDSGPYAFPVTRLGTPTQGSITPYWPNGYWSNYFVASAALYNASVSNMSFGISTNFTIEAFINWPAAAAGNQTFFELTGTTRMILGRTTTGTRIYWNGTEKGTTYTFTPGTWYHFAIVRNSGTVYCYINGVSAITPFTETVTWASTRFNIGMNSDTAEPMTGYISNLRVVNNVAVYTSSFIPPTNPLAATQSAGTNISAITGTSTSLLTCQSNRFIDNSTSNYTITLQTGTTKVQSFQPFSPPTSYTPAAYGGSGYFPLSQSDYLQFPVSSAFAPGTGNFTLECWVYVTSLPVTDAFIWTQCVSGTNYFLFGFNTTAYFYATLSGGGTPINGPASSILLNVWNHIAVTRVSGIVRVFVNGVSGTPTSNTTDLSNLSYVPTVGRYAFTTSYGYFNGYMSNLRYVKGVAVYTGNFTPPSLGLLTNSGSTSAVAYSNTANVNTVFGSSSTSLLENFSNLGIYDATAQNDLISVSGAQASNTVVKWADSTSMRFNGSSDYLTIPTNSALNLGTGSFTVEAWVYLNATSSDYFVISASGSGGAFFGFTSSTNIGYGRTAVAWDYNIASGIIPKVWYHLAWCRSGTSMRIFVNGTQVGTTQTTSQSYDLSTTSTNVGSQGANYYLNGYIQDLRVTNAIARYTANFTPPVLPFLTL